MLVCSRNWSQNFEYEIWRAARAETTVVVRRKIITYRSKTNLNRRLVDGFSSHDNLTSGASLPVFKQVVGVGLRRCTNNISQSSFMFSDEIFGSRAIVIVESELDRLREFEIVEDLDGLRKVWIEVIFDGLGLADLLPLRVHSSLHTLHVDDHVGVTLAHYVEVLQVAA